MSKFNAQQILNKVVKYGDDLIGHSKNQFKIRADVLRDAKTLGKEGVPQSTIDYAHKAFKKAKADSFSARAHTVAGVGAVGVAGSVIAIKHYHKRDKETMQRLDNLWKKE